jgi:diketogulonate reductase-like aldo/keto reductase
VDQPTFSTPGVPTRRLSDGSDLPLLGLGVWQIPNGPECVDAVRWALELGYRHVDTAQAYGNEESVGQALRESGLDRDEVFITTKFYPGRKDPAAELEGSLRRLGIDHVDLYIVHWPQGGATWAWPGMETARKHGHAHSIGVSNFDTTELEQVAEVVQDWPPVVNQVLFNPFAYRRRLLEDCESRDITLEAYSPLGTGRHLADPTVGEIAKAHDRTPAQVLLRWCVQREIPVISKSTNRERIESNSHIFDFELSDHEMTTLDGLDQTHGTNEALERRWW